MSLVSTDNQYYSDIADAIRAKLNSQSTYKPRQMADAVLSIVTGIHKDALSMYTLDELPFIFAPSAVEQVME